MTILRQLSNIPLVAGLSHQQLAQVADCCCQREFARGDTIYHQGVSARQIYLIVEGLVSLDDVMPDADAWISYERHGPGELIGVASLMRLQVHSLTATCLEPTVAIEIDVNALEKLFAQDPEIGFKVMYEVAYIFYQRYEKAKTRLYNVFREIPVRLICRE
ncbi:MAG: cyclic nucleotide-binding domain-containing protein [Deltaproteobacteria bacterium]|nr:cyclic nucleotide-binding domain-containing protein [Deltaproteobacteria bacterium]MBW1953051.1 cyclic nucleotide-binding domain-containing protein [Deltaproteobacteria bacterium]MBW1985927.1 cyclic nucleotide-binding domain-containing protein [Deltaproteobacteria bacterium]MBW2133687.1 cyclic nucleotide-binding domain-containing protein [Deltaproteobacteria bacterium]